MLAYLGPTRKVIVEVAAARRLGGSITYQRAEGAIVGRKMGRR